jgi:PAS domain S-box-containing protein
MSKVNGTRRDRGRAARRWWVVAWLLFAAICAAAVWYFAAVFIPHERAAAIELWRGRLSAMADDRKAAITAWLGERRGAARVVAEYPTVIVMLAGPEALSSPLPPWEVPQRQLQGLLDSLRAAYGYRGMYVIASTNQVVASSTWSPPLGVACRQINSEVLQSGLAKIDFYADADGSPMLAVVAPVRVRERTVGAVLLSIDPERWLYPLLRAEPVRSATGEWLLARQEGDQIQYLSPLRHRPAQPLSFRLPANAEPLAAAAAIRSEEGFKEYHDYWGVPVLGAARRIPDTGWGLVVKVDRNEALAGLGRGVWQGALAIEGLLLAVAGFGFGVQRAVAARHRRELSESEARFALLRDHANDAIFFASRGGVILDVNRRAEAFYARRREELLGLPFDELRAPEEGVALSDRFAALAPDDETVFEAVHRRPDGTSFPVEVSTRVMELGGQDVFLSIVRDITDRKRDEMVLHDSEERFRALFESSPNGIFLTDSETLEIVDCNKIACAMNGYSREELVGKSINVLHPEEIVRRTEAGVEGRRSFVNKLRENGVVTVESVHRRKDGSLFPLETSMCLLPVTDRILVMGIDRDITERKQGEEALREREQNLATIYSTVGDAIFQLEVDKDGRYWFASVNPAFIATTGLTAADVIGKRVDQIIPEPSLSMVLERYATAIREKRLVRWEETSEYPTGTLTGEVSIAPVFDDAGHCTHLAGAVHDVTERKRAQDALQRQAAELEARIEELERFNRAAVGRENRMVELKQQVNELCRQLGKPPMYPLGFLDPGSQASVPAPPTKGREPSSDA